MNENEMRHKENRVIGKKEIEIIGINSDTQIIKKLKEKR